MLASASFFHALSSFWDVSRSVTKAACVFKLSTTCYRKRCTSWNYAPTFVWQLYTSWHQLPITANLSAMVLFPFSSVSFISIRRYPSYASVFIARACIWELSFAGGVYWFAWILTVMLLIVDKSGSCAAKALRSTGVIVGMVGGASYTFALTISSLKSISSPHCISSYY
jgi:hypothetical protein